MGQGGSKVKEVSTNLIDGMEQLKLPCGGKCSAHALVAARDT
jgi:hypothetical protein